MAESLLSVRDAEQAAAGLLPGLRTFAELGGRLLAAGAELATAGKGAGWRHWFVT